MDKRISYGGLIFIAVVWGSTFPIIKDALYFIDPLSFLFFRFLIAAVVMIPFILRKFNRKDAVYGSLVGIPLFLGYVTQTIGLRYTSPSMSGLITGLYVVLTPIISIFVLKTGTDLTKLLLTGVAFVGMGLMTVSSTSGEILGNALTVVTAFAYAFQLVLTEKYLVNGNPLVFTFFQLVVVSVLSFVFDPLSVTKISILGNYYVLFAVVFNAIFGSTLAIWIMSAAVKNTNAYISALILILEPVFAILVSTLFFGFPLTFWIVTGGVIILLAMALAISRENKKI